MLEQKSQCEVEVRQTDSHGTITARDNYELTRNMPKCVGVERLCDDAYMHANFQIPFNADEINLIYQFGEQNKAETCAEITATTKRRKLDTLAANFCWIGGIGDLENIHYSRVSSAPMNL